MKLDLVLHDKVLALRIDSFCEFARHGMVSSCVFSDKTLVAIYSLVDSGFLDLPVADILPFFLIGLCLLLCM